MVATAADVVSETLDDGAGTARRDRLHFLDWLRALLVGFVVYAHLIFCGAQLGRPDDEGSVDDHAYNTGKPNQLAVRWLSVVRQWCIPLLFWVSGAASALSFRRSTTRWLKGMSRIFYISIVGIAGNAAMWLLGPRDPNCSFRTPCPGKGIVFDFTEDPYSGTVEPYVNQMWYTVVLLLLSLINRPFFSLLSAGVDGANVFSRWTVGWLVVQFAVMVTIYVALTLLASSDCLHPTSLLVCLALSESAFMLLALASSWWWPHRIMHYACAAVAILRLSITPIARMPIKNDITPSYLLYLILATSSWFQMGFIMTHSRIAGAGVRDVRPLASQMWPLVLFPMVLCCSSTNWVMAGVLPYPLLPGTVDQLLYVGGTFLVMFVVDRCSRCIECRPMPHILSTASNVVYIFQVVFITVFLQLLKSMVQHDIGPTSRADGQRTVVFILTLSILTSVAAVATHMALRRATSQCWQGAGDSPQQLQIHLTGRDTA